jgi:sulfide:quinone oxidoreductase
VFAAGDLTDFPVKQGGIATQQADSAANAIAALAGANVMPNPIVPVLCGLLWDGGQPLYLRARMTGTHGSRSEVSTEPLWSPPGKIQAMHLGRYLDTVDKEPLPTAHEITSTHAS